MKSKLFAAIGLVVAAFLALLILNGNFPTGMIALGDSDSQPDVLKVGWMISWYDPGMLAEALKNTDILAKNNAHAEMVSFSAAAPILEAALAKKVDATFLGITPSTVLLSKSNDWIIVARMIKFQEIIMVRNDSGISTISDLKGKKIGLPFASGPHTPIVKALEGASLVPGKDVELINIKPADLPLALETKQVDAVAWGATLKLAIEEKGFGKQIAAFNDFGVIMVSKKYASEHPEQVRNFLKAMKEANLFVAQNKKQVFEWYAKDSSFTLQYVESLPLTEPNYNAKSISDVDLSLPKGLVAEMQNTVDYMQKIGIIDKRVDLTGVIDQSYLP